MSQRPTNRTEAKLLEDLERRALHDAVAAAALARWRFGADTLAEIACALVPQLLDINASLQTMIARYTERYAPPIVSMVAPRHDRPGIDVDCKHCGAQAGDPCVPARSGR